MPISQGVTLPINIFYNRYRNIPRKYTAELLYAGEGAQQVQNEIYDILQPKFKDTCLVLDTVGIREIKFPPAFIKAISEKQIAKINIVTEENKAKQELHKKHKKLLLLKLLLKRSYYSNKL